MHPKSPWHQSGFFPLVDTLYKRLVEPCMTSEILDSQLGLPSDTLERLKDYRLECYREVEIAPAEVHALAAEPAPSQPDDLAEVPSPPRRASSKRSADAVFDVPRPETLRLLSKSLANFAPVQPRVHSGMFKFGQKVSF